MDLGGEPIPDRCPRCSKAMVVDIGAGLWGQGQVLAYCLSCGTPPEQTDWALGLTAAVAAVRARRGA